jgi:hypothetical protein
MEGDAAEYCLLKKGFSHEESFITQGIYLLLYGCDFWYKMGGLTSPLLYGIEGGDVYTSKYQIRITFQKNNTRRRDKIITLTEYTDGPFSGYFIHRDNK